MIRLIRLFEEETGYIYPKNYREWMEWHPKYHDWLQKKLVKLLDNQLQPLSGEMYLFLLNNALRSLNEEQRAGLCFDLYSRNEQPESIDNKIELLKLYRQSNKN